MVRQTAIRRRCGSAAGSLLLAGAVALAGAGCAVTGGDPAARLPQNHVLAAGAAPPAAGSVSTFPIPGSHYALPGTQIAFRGLDPASIGQLTVRGSTSGVHTGRLQDDSDGDGGSFLPDTPFDPGETVTVTTRLPVIGSSAGTFSFVVERPAKPIGPGSLRSPGSAAGIVQHYASAPGLQPPAISVTRNTSPGRFGDLFLAPQEGVRQAGPMIVGADGQLVWFHPIATSTKTIANDFDVQRLDGKPVLTWWQGTINHGSGRGVGIVDDDHYRQIATVHAADGLSADLHEFLLTNGGDAWLIAASPVRMRGASRPVIDSTVQEVDIKTGLVLFEWHSLDHIPLSQSHRYATGLAGHVLDPYHLNSISLLPNGDPVVSVGNTWAAYAIDKRTGRILWELGGRGSSFQVGPRAAFAFQHDVVMHGADTATVFDNGAGPPRVQPASRGLVVHLDQRTHRATLVRAYSPQPTVSAPAEGSVQALGGGEALLGFGETPFFDEFAPNGQTDLVGRFVAPKTGSYRAFRMPWTGRPTTRPSVSSAPTQDGRLNVSVSWNGATAVARWRVLGGASRTALKPVGSAADRGFETTITVPRQGAVAVEAIGSGGAVLGRSAALGAR